MLCLLCLATPALGWYLACSHCIARRLLNRAASAGSGILRGMPVFIKRLLPDASLVPAQAATVTDGGLETWPDAGSAFNIGIMLFRQGALPFAQVCTPARTWWAEPVAGQQQQLWRARAELAASQRVCPGAVAL